MNRTSRYAALTAYVLLAALASNCSTADTHSQVSWQAKLDTMPDPDCVKGAIAVTYAVSLADYKHVAKTDEAADRFLINVPRTTEPVMGLTFVRTGGEAVAFTLNYGYSRTSDWANNTAARALIQSIASRCGVPELAQRASRTLSDHWDGGLSSI